MSQQLLDRITRWMLLGISALLILLAVLTVVFLITLPRDAKPTPGGDKPGGTTADTSATTTGTTPTPAPNDHVTLPETPDAGLAYQDKIVFVGDSLTAHLVSRGVLSDGKDTRQVWRTESNMLNLNSAVTSTPIILPSTGEPVTIAEAARREKPAILIITLGTDYGVSYLGEADFKACYSKLVKEIQTASPDTVVILQSIFPVTAGCTLLDNSKIDTANTWVKAVAAEHGCRYLDTQSILKDGKGALRADYCNSTDGIHLGAEAYKAILAYIRTHAVTA